MYVRSLVLFISFFMALNIKAQTCCSGGIPLSNNLGLSNQGKGGIQLGLNYDFNNLNTLNSGSEKLDDDARKRLTHSLLFNLGYSFSDKWSIEGLFTWVNQRRIIDQFNNTDLQQTSGVGDAVLLLKRDFLGFLGSNSSLTLGLGAKVPLGSFTETDAIGITYIADLQPGSGAWDFLAFTAMAKNFDFRPSMTFSGRIIGRFTGKNKAYLNGASVYRYGNEFQMFIGVSDQLLVFNTITQPGLSFKYRHAKKDVVDANALDNTGGNWLFISPRIGLNLTPSIVFQAMAELPLVGRVDGTQLTPTYRITSGVLIDLNFKKNTIKLK